MTTSSDTVTLTEAFSNYISSIQAINQVDNAVVQRLNNLEVLEHQAKVLEKQSRLNETIQSYEQAVTENTQLQAQNQAFLSEIDSLKRNVQSLTAGLVEELTTLKQNVSAEEKSHSLETSQFQKTISELATELSKSKAALSKQLAQFTSISNEKTSLESQLSTIKKDHSDIKTAKEALEKQFNSLKSSHETDLKIIARLESEKSDHQGQEKKLKTELGESKTQLNKQVKASEKLQRDLDKATRQFSAQKSVLESKIESLKNKIKSMEANRPRIISNKPHLPAANESYIGAFSPGATRSMQSPQNTHSAATISSFSTTPFLQRNHPTGLGSRLPADKLSPGKPVQTNKPISKNSISPPKRTSVSPKPVQLKVRSENENASKTVPESVREAQPEKSVAVPLPAHKTGPSNDLLEEFSKPSLFSPIGSKPIRHISLFDDEEDIKSTPVQPPRRRKKLNRAASKASLFDDEDADDPDNPNSAFKRIKPGPTLLTGEISPLKSRNRGKRNAFRI